MKNMHSTSEKTRSDAAELGAMAKMMRAALAQVGIDGGVGALPPLEERRGVLLHVRRVEPLAGRREQRCRR